MEDSEAVRMIGGKLLYNTALDHDLIVVKSTTNFALEQVEVTDNSTKGAIFNIDAMSEVTVKDSTVEKNKAKTLTYSKDAILVENSLMEENDFTK